MGLITPRSTIRKRFIVAESDSLVLETIQTYRGDCPRSCNSPVQTKGTVPKQELRLLKLKGTWRANSQNELVFEAAGHKTRKQTYTFRGAWKLNNNQQIEYTTEDSRDTLTFKGFWQIPSNHKLVYILEGSSESRFEFKVHLESASMYPKKGAIRYRIGIGTRKSRKTSPGQLLILYGEWKFSRNLGLSFNIDYGRGKIRGVGFGAEVTFDRNKINLALDNEFGKPLGVTLTLTRQLFKSLDAKAFLKLSNRRQDQSIESGITIPF